MGQGRGEEARKMPLVYAGTPMNVGILQVSFALERVRSLKEKRRVVKSILGRVRAEFNVSAAEVDDQDLWKSAGLAFAAVSSDPQYLRGQLDTLLDALRRHPEARVVDHQIELL